MPTLNRNLAALFAALFIIAVGWLNGCSTAPAYKTLYAVGHTVDTAMQTYMNLVVDHKVATNDVPAVSRVYNDFQSAYRTALAAAQFNANVPPDTNLTARVSIVLGIITAAQGGAKP